VPGAGVVDGEEDAGGAQRGQRRRRRPVVGHGCVLRELEHDLPVAGGLAHEGEEQGRRVLERRRREVDGDVADGQLVDLPHGEVEDGDVHRRRQTQTLARREPDVRRRPVRTAAQRFDAVQLAGVEVDDRLVHEAERTITDRTFHDATVGLRLHLPGVPHATLLEGREPQA
jgi:hypothetical protein